ncbi:hypothetical protein M011DRAFT_488550 [Sporormia fimetaria CBS 119925]|uniref:Uncharacterized protein n=1 Tax=Sporormia fimetaria CBS 119925 TaxID=1340428 RepID=A0A6A6V6U1_9PLEO|nr:hypothetical protein M011DRAFT_488550 [Sporormia fimetaria CBS 119925]
MSGPISAKEWLKWFDRYAAIIESINYDLNDVTLQQCEAKLGEGKNYPVVGNLDSPVITRLEHHKRWILLSEEIAPHKRRQREQEGKDEKEEAAIARIGEAATKARDPRERFRLEQQKAAMERERALRKQKATFKARERALEQQKADFMERERAKLEQQNPGKAALVAGERSKLKQREAALEEQIATLELERALEQPRRKATFVDQRIAPQSEEGAYIEYRKLGYDSKTAWSLAKQKGAQAAYGAPSSAQYRRSGF